jgi:hypothetical protein
MNLSSPNTTIEVTNLSDKEVPLNSQTETTDIPTGNSNHHLKVGGSPSYASNITLNFSYADSGLLELLPLPHRMLLMLWCLHPSHHRTDVVSFIVNNLKCCRVRMRHL